MALVHEHSNPESTFSYVAMFLLVPLIQNAYDTKGVNDFNDF